MHGLSDFQVAVPAAQAVAAAEQLTPWPIIDDHEHVLASLGHAVFYMPAAEPFAELLPLQFGLPVSVIGLALKYRYRRIYR